MYVGRLTQWHANTHLVRHLLFLLLVLGAYVRKRVVRPALAVIEALRALSVVSAQIDALEAKQ